MSPPPRGAEFPQWTSGPFTEVFSGKTRDEWSAASGPRSPWSRGRAGSSLPISVVWLLASGTVAVRAEITGLIPRSIELEPRRFGKCPEGMEEPRGQIRGIP